MIQGYFALATLILLVIFVLFRSYQLKKAGIKAIKFGAIDKKDFFIIPLVILFFYFILVKTVNLSKSGPLLPIYELLSWFGVLFCIIGLLFFLYALVSFGKSFRVGLDEEHASELITEGAFSISRNPIYTAFGIVLWGIFLIFPSVIFLLYFIAGIWLFNRQIRLEEQSLKKLYGEKYIEYCKKVRRFL